MDNASALYCAVGRQLLNVTAPSLVLGFISGCAGPPLGLPAGTQSPAVNGAFSPCETELTKTVPIEGDIEITVLSLALYLPRSAAGPDCASIASPDRPLVLLYHALGQDEFDYDALGLRLSSHGFVVASLQHETQLNEAIDFLDEEIGGFLSDDVALVGHSAGGDLMVRRRGQPAALGRSVRTMVLMAPRVSGDTVEPDYALSGVDAFLGLHWRGDNDNASWGRPSPAGGGVRRSVFRIYDRAGVDFDDPETLGLSKHFVFFDYTQHNNQNRDGVVAYTTAFLRRHVLDDESQDLYLKHMSPPPQLAAEHHPISQQHEEPGRVLLANFEEDVNAAVYKGLFERGVRLLPSPAGIIFAFSDPFSPHDLGVLRFRFDAQTEPEHSVAILLNQGVPTEGMNYLSFRITQEYHPETSPTGGIIDFDIGIASLGDHFVDSEDYQRLAFPALAQNVMIAQTSEQVDGTKNAMRTYLIPLEDFDLGNPDFVQGVTFDFTDSGEPPGETIFITIDQVQLTE